MEKRTVSGPSSVGPSSSRVHRHAASVLDCCNRSQTTTFTATSRSPLRRRTPPPHSSPPASPAPPPSPTPPASYVEHNDGTRSSGGSMFFFHQQDASRWLVADERSKNREEVDAWRVDRAREVADKCWRSPQRCGPHQRLLHRSVDRSGRKLGRFGRACANLNLARHGAHSFRHFNGENAIRHRRADLFWVDMLGQTH